MVPLAERLRPKCIDEMVGQPHLFGEGRPMRRIVESGTIPNMIFYGPSGVGKTTLARMIADRTELSLHKLNGTTASVSDIREILQESGSLFGSNGILLYLDEIQYLNKKQQQRGRRNTRPVRRFGHNDYCGRETKPHGLRYGIGSALLRHNTQTLDAMGGGKRQGRRQRGA